jgi:hypothetical protein
MAVACSIHAPALSSADLVVGYAMKDDRTHCTRRLVPGIDLRFGGPWSGVSLGLSSLVVVEPMLATAPDSEPAESTFALPFGWRTRSAEGRERWFGITLPRLGRSSSHTFLVAHSLIGIDVRTNELQPGLTIGALRTTVLHTDPSRSGSYVSRFSSRRPEEATLESIEESN